MARPFKCVRNRNPSYLQFVNGFIRHSLCIANTVMCLYVQYVHSFAISQIVKEKMAQCLVDM